MLEVPTIKEMVWQFQTYSDDNGFAWISVLGRRYSNREIVDAAMEALGNLL